jgi:site-specific recombinase XerD
MCRRGSQVNLPSEKGLTAKTVNRKVVDIRNYWQWMQDHLIVAKDHNPFSHRRKSKEGQGRRFQPEE